MPTSLIFLCNSLIWIFRRTRWLLKHTHTCMHFPTCCLAIMGSMTSAICLDNLFHLSSFSLWHCCSTRMNISNTYNTRVKANVRQRKDWLKYFVTLACRVCANLWPYLMVLHKSEQHGDHHFFLSIKLLACICFVWAPQHKEVVDYWLQGWDGCGGRKKANWITLIQYPMSVIMLLLISVPLKDRH